MGWKSLLVVGAALVDPTRRAVADSEDMKLHVRQSPALSRCRRSISLTSGLHSFSS
jgi:hypothetical protein